MNEHALVEIITDLQAEILALRMLTRKEGFHDPKFHTMKEVYRTGIMADFSNRIGKPKEGLKAGGPLTPEDLEKLMYFETDFAPRTEKLTFSAADADPRISMEERRIRESMEQEKELKNREQARALVVAQFRQMVKDADESPSRSAEQACRRGLWVGFREAVEILDPKLAAQLDPNRVNW